MRATFLRFRLFIVLLLAITPCYQAVAQQNHANSITLTFTDYKFRTLLSDQYVSVALFYDQMGLSFERRLNKYIEVAISYSQWINFGHNAFSSEPATINWTDNRSVTMGDINARQNYKLIDLFVKYRCHLNKRNELKMGMGLSYTTGTNVYIDSITNLPYFNTVYTHTETGKYWGFVPLVGYDHHFFKNRISAGADFRYRKYIGIPADQLDYGMHIAVNF